MDNKKIDDLVAMIDSFMQNDGGHMNVTVNDNGEIETDKEYIDKDVVTLGCLDCADNMACSVPTLFEGMDRDENNK